MGRDAWAVGQKNKLTLSLGQERLDAPWRRSRSTHPINLSVRRGLPRTWDRG